MEITTTSRGFQIGKFKDRNGAECSIQKSSIAYQDCIWLGIEDADPKIMASQAASHGIKTNQENGWVEFPIPSEVLLTTRMHLTQEQVAALLPVLAKFAETGELD